MLRKQCKVCLSDKADIVLAELKRGLSVREVGRRHGFGPSSIHRHRVNCLHMPASTTEPVDNEPVGGLLTMLERLLRRAEKAGHTGTAVKILQQIAELRRRMPVKGPAAKREVQINVRYAQRLSDSILLRHLQEFVGRSKNEKALAYAARLAAVLLEKPISADLDAELAKAGAPASESTPAGGSDSPAGLAETESGGEG